MLSKKMCVLLNKQIETEANASSTYLAMASWLEVQGYEGSSAFLYGHSNEEREHMMKLLRYVNERGGHGLVPALKAPAADYKSLGDIFEDLLEHEIKVSKEINKLVDAALDEKDFATHNFLQWYVQEQMEEERLARTVLDKFKLIGNDKGGLYMLDRELAALAASEGAEGEDE
jgi:ferritin